MIMTLDELEATDGGKKQESKGSCSAAGPTRNCYNQYGYFGLDDYDYSDDYWTGGVLRDHFGLPINKQIGPVKD